MGQRVGLLPNAPELTRGELSQLVRTWGATPFSIALAVLATIRREIGPRDIAPPTRQYHLWSAGSVLLEALRLCPAAHPEFALKKVTTPNVDELFRRANGLMNQRVASREDTLLGVAALLMQTSLQGDLEPKIFRTLFLLELVDEFGTLRGDSPFDHLFREHLGCSAIDYMVMVYSLYLMSTLGPVSDLTRSYEASARATTLTDATEALLRARGCRVGDVESLCSGKYRDYKGDGLVQAFFTQTPYVRLLEGRWLLPPHSFGLFLATSGPIHDTLELARKTYKAKGASNSAVNADAEHMGETFEKLVGRTLVNSGRGDLEREHRYRKEQKSPDHLIFEGTSVVLVQEKLKHLRAGTFFAYNFEDLKTDIRGIVAETIWKSVRYVAEIRRAKRNGTLLASALPIAERVLASERVFLLGVVPSMPSFLCVPEFRSLLEEGVVAALDKLKDEEAKDWWRQRILRRASWHVLEWPELSTFARVAAPEHGLYQSLHDHAEIVEGWQRTAQAPLPPSFGDHQLDLNSARIREGHALPPSEYRASFEAFDRYVRSILALSR